MKQLLLVSMLCALLSGCASIPSILSSLTGSTNQGTQVDVEAQAGKNNHKSNGIQGDTVHGKDVRISNNGVEASWLIIALLLSIIANVVGPVLYLRIWLRHRRLMESSK